MIPINRQTIPTVHCSLACSGQRYFSAAMAIVCIFLSSCSDDRWAVPESSLQAEPTTPALDVRKIINELPQSEKEAQADWTNAVGAFGAFYSEDILRIGAANDPATIQKIKEFSVHPDVAPIESAIDSTSGSPETLARNEEQLSQALHRFRYFLPSEPTC